MAGYITDLCPNHTPLIYHLMPTKYLKIDKSSTLSH